MSHSPNNLSSSPLEQTLARVQALDLDRITRKVGQKQGWDAVRAGEAELQYRHYLTLLLVYPGKQIAPPSKDADEIWHGHILDTPAYQRDCEQLFGHFLHHLPSYGTPEEKLLMAEAREQSEALFERHFGRKAEGAAETALCVCLSEPAKQDQPREEAGCICYSDPAKKEKEVQAGDGCVPCLGRHLSPEKAASVETDRVVCYVPQTSNAKVSAAEAAR
jgi:hypothetical protein